MKHIHNYASSHAISLLGIRKTIHAGHSYCEHVLRNWNICKWLYLGSNVCLKKLNLAIFRYLSWVARGVSITIRENCLPDD